MDRKCFVESRFRFTAKLIHSFTRERQPLPNDEKEFKEGIAPIAEADRLGALLLQFPWSFKFSSENRQYLTWAGGSTPAPMVAGQPGR